MKDPIVRNVFFTWKTKIVWVPLQLRNSWTKTFTFVLAALVNSTLLQTRLHQLCLKCIASSWHLMFKIKWHVNGCVHPVHCHSNILNCPCPKSTCKGETLALCFATLPPSNLLTVLPRAGCAQWLGCKHCLAWFHQESPALTWMMHATYSRHSLLENLTAVVRWWLLLISPPKLRLNNLDHIVRKGLTGLAKIMKSLFLMCLRSFWWIINNKLT